MADDHRGLGVALTDEASIIRNRSGQPYTKDKLAADFRAIQEKVFPGDTRRLQGLSAMGGNTIAQSTALFETDTPAQLAAVRQADEARRIWREKLKKNG